jgi:hypothetical protein
LTVFFNFHLFVNFKRPYSSKKIFGIELLYLRNRNADLNFYGLTTALGVQDCHATIAADRNNVVVKYFNVIYAVLMNLDDAVRGQGTFVEEHQFSFSVAHDDILRGGAD